MSDGDANASTYLCLRAESRFNVVHYINMDVAQDDSLLRQVWALPEDAPENHPRLCRRDLDGSFDTLEAVRRNRVNRRPLYDFEVSESRKIQAQILQGV